MLTEYSPCFGVRKDVVNEVMTNVERFHAVMNFEKPDRLPMYEWAGWWGATLDRWYEEGLPREIPWDRIQTHFGLDFIRRIWMPLETADCPRPKVHGGPLIESAEEYEAFKKYLYPDESQLTYQRKINILKALKEEHEKGEALLWYSYDGFFWFPRTLLGIENHLYSFYDEPELYHKICSDLADYIIACLPKIYEICTPDFMVISEDMSYNNGPMLSEALFDEFLLPYYQRIIPEIKKYGTKVIVDTDGDVSMMIPWLKRAGVDGVLPLERQAGVDLVRLRREHPDFLFLGGFDKMTMPKGEAAMRAEFERLLPVMRSGGFIPSCDHQTPPGVSLENYRIFVRLLEEYAQKAVK
jgi:uroporphyrinogen-III decarboxylase